MHTEIRVTIRRNQVVLGCIVIMNKSGKKWIAFDFGSEKIDVRKSPLKVKPKESPVKIPKPVFPVSRKRPFNFLAKLSPNETGDLAIHPKKLVEVQAWIEAAISDFNKKDTTAFLLLTGPTGAGKTTTVQVICKSLGILISEWINPVDQDFELVRGPNQVDRFIEFLTESKWNSLFSNGNEKKIILVKDFPNAVIRNSSEFLTVLEECYYKTKYPIVFICTDASKNGINMERLLFPQETQDKYNIKVINFNACAATLLKNALKRAQDLVQKNSDLFKVPSQTTVDAILASSLGDIRNAVNQYYFASLIGSENLPTVKVAIEKSGAKRKRKDGNTALTNMTKDETLGLFHGLGRVLNPKRIEIGNGGWKLNCNVEKLVEEFTTQPEIFTSFLFENYIKYFGSLKDASKASEFLSISQIFLEKWTDRHETLVFAIWVSVLGLMIHNKNKISKWNQIRAPTKTKKCINEMREVDQLAATDYFYYNIINNCEKYHIFKDRC